MMLGESGCCVAGGLTYFLNHSFTHSPSLRCCAGASRPTPQKPTLSPAPVRVLHEVLVCARASGALRRMLPQTGAAVCVPPRPPTPRACFTTVHPPIPFLHTACRLRSLSSKLGSNTLHSLPRPPSLTSSRTLFACVRACILCSHSPTRSWVRA